MQSPRGTAGVVLVAWLAAGCAEAPVCTLVDARSGVRVFGGENGATLELCLGSECRPATFFRTTGAFVDVPSLRIGERSTMTAAYVSKGKRVRSTVTVVPQSFRPNGVQCPPNVALAYLRVAGDGRVAGRE